MKKLINTSILYLIFFNCSALSLHSTYPSLVELCKELRLLERTHLPDGVPDYRVQTILKTQTSLKQYQGRFTKIDTSGWPL